MRTFVFAVGLGLCVASGAFGATAAEAGHSGYQARSSEAAAEQQLRRQQRREERQARDRRYSQDSEADRIRTESCDPAGRFESYPAWARAAFTCGSQR